MIVSFVFKPALYSGCKIGKRRARVENRDRIHANLIFDMELLDHEYHFYQIRTPAISAVDACHVDAICHFCLTFLQKAAVGLLDFAPRVAYTFQM